MIKGRQVRITVLLEGNNGMKIYFAPLEGIGGFLYRNAYFKYFDHADKYFAPFIAASQNGVRNKKEIRDILPENNRDVPVVPQLLVSRPEEFNIYAHYMSSLGYKEINLNLGCPSRTVVTKHKGSGLLAFPDELERLLDGIFSDPVIRISVKTRIGIDSPDEFHDLLRLFNSYPVSELIIHPRTQKEAYGGKPHLDIFGEAVEKSCCPVCYNGDICTEEDYRHLCDMFPDIKAVMIGRGFLKDPGLITRLKSGKQADLGTLIRFHDFLFESYTEAFSGERPVLFKMKELWSYLGEQFPGTEKLQKKIRKTQRFSDYRGLVYEIFQTCPERRKD